MKDITRSDFVIIDDDSVNNMICTKIIHKISPASDIKSFTNPVSGLDYIRALIRVPGGQKTILFLDINMPEMTGWEFMTYFDPLENKGSIEVYILSSSVDPSDKQKAKLNKNIKDYIVKPLYPDLIRKIAGII